MEIIEYPVTNEIIEEFRKYLFIGKDTIDIENKNFIKVFDDSNNLITIALITLPNGKTVSNIIKKDLFYLIDDNDLTEINNLHEQLDNRVYLDAIYSINKNKGGAKELLKYLENKYNALWIYSLFEAEEFWEYLEWKELIEHVYINK